MNIHLNGKAKELPDDSSISGLIELLELTGKRYAVEVNESLIPRSQHQNYQLNADDVVEIVHAIGGG